METKEKNMTLIKYDTFINERIRNGDQNEKKSEEQEKSLIITQRTPEKDHKIRLILENRMEN